MGPPLSGVVWLRHEGSFSAWWFLPATVKTLDITIGSQATSLPQISRLLSSPNHRPIRPFSSSLFSSSSTQRRRRTPPHRSSPRCSAAPSRLVSRLLYLRSMMATAQRLREDVEEDGGVEEQEWVAAELHPLPHAKKKTSSARRNGRRRRRGCDVSACAHPDERTRQVHPRPPLFSLLQCRHDGMRRLHLGLWRRHVQACRWLHLGLRRGAATRPWLLLALPSYLD